MKSKLAVRVTKPYAEVIRIKLTEKHLLDGSRKIIRLNDYIELPIIDKSVNNDLENIKDILELEKAISDNISIIIQDTPVVRSTQLEPFKIIYDKCEALCPDLPEKALELLPRKWELLGDVLIVKFPPELIPRIDTVVKAYAEVLGAETVLRETEIIKGPLRIPTMEVLYGTRTETVHRENGVRFKLDTAKLIFSSGNIDERERMAKVSNPEEVVVDMFAGIGYFTLPIAVHSKPKKVFACELNPVAYQYLQENIELNNVNNIVEPIRGDNRETAPDGVADRVIMGYIKDTRKFLPKAFEILKTGGGIIHYHDTCPNELLPDRPFERLKEVAEAENKNVELLNFKNIKSYAPGVSHVVLDVIVNS